MTDWHNDFGSDPEDDESEPVLTTGDMTDGESVTFEVAAEPETIDTDNGDALRVPVEFRESDHDFETESGQPFEDGMRVVLLTWSKRLGRALMRAEKEYSGEVGGGLAGATIRLHKTGEGYDVDYNAVVVESDD